MTAEFIDSQSVREYLLGLQQRIVDAFERLDGKRFGHDVWEKPEDAQLGGGGLTRIIENGKTRQIPPPAPRPVARADTTFLVVNMMRSVMNEGTGAGARSAGFTLDAAGKTGTTNDLRDAWFIGFTPELLTAVWVGFDNNQPIGLSGSQAAVPIWTAFMKRALAAHPNKAFVAPDGVVFAEIDKANGKLATPMCPSVINEAFLAGTQPTEFCDVHGTSNPVSGFFSKVGRLFGRIIR